VKPEAWKDLPFDRMEKQVEQYTAEVMKDLKTDGLLPDIVQVGNEITGGTLWPDAQVRTPPSSIKSWDRDQLRPSTQASSSTQPYDEARQWERLAGVVKAGVRGVRSVTTSPADRVRVMIHIDCGGDWPTTQWFFDHMNQHQVQYDVIGLSYYPNWHGTVDDLRNNLREIVGRYHKDIIVVETAYPWKNAADWTHRSNMTWPITPDGQRRFLADVIRAVRETPDARGLGVVYWHPESVQGKTPGGRAWNGGAMALFDDDGKALPAIDALNPPKP
jgi:arabinogalactan endo-1,4-beta-galactosidase